MKDVDIFLQNNGTHKMTKDELRDLIIETKELLSKLDIAWKRLSDKDIREATEIKHLPCDSCEEEEDV